MAKRGPERATETRQYDLLRPNVGQKEPPKLGSTVCYGQELARKSHQDSAVRFVTAKRGPERATKTRQYDLLRPRVGQKEPPRLGSTICYGQELSRKSHQDSAVRFVTAKSWPERATKTRQYDLLRPNVGQKEPPKLGSTICYGQELARKSHQNSAVRFVTAKRGPERATKTRQYDLLRSERTTKTRQYDLLRPRVGQKEPPRLGSTICYGQELARKSHRDSAVRFVTAKRGPERATKTRQYDLLRPRVGQKEHTKTRQYDLLRPNVGQKEPPKLGSTICYGQTWARKSHQNSAVRFVTAKSWPERATKTRQYDLLRPNVGQKEPPKLGSTICYGQELARKSHQDSAVRFVTAKRGPERATKTRQYDLLRPRVGQKEPPRLGSTICCGQTWARKSHQDSAVRFVTAKRWPERATKTRQHDLLRPRVGQKEPPRLGSTICYGQTWARKSHQNSAVRFVTAKSWPERTTKTRQSDLLRPRVVQKEPPRLGSTICYGQTWARKSHRDSAVRFVTAKRGPERATKTRQYDLLRPRVGQKEPPRLGSTICYGQTWARKSHQNSAVRFVTAKRGPERATETRQYDLLRPNVGQKEPPRLGSTICYGQELARKSHQDSAVRFATAKRGRERATKTRQYDLLRPRVGQKEPPRLGSTICYGQTWARKSHQNSAVRFVTAKRGPERATKTRQYDLLRPNVGQKEPPKLGSTICYGQELARKNHQDSAVRFVTAKRGPERATKTRQYDLLRPRVGQKEPPRLGSTICYGQTWARKSHQDSAVRFVTAKRGPERATKTRQYDLLRPRVGQKEPPRLGSTICYGQTWARKSHQNSAVRFVTAKSWPDRATTTRQCDLLRPNVGQKEPPRLGSTICYGQTWARKSHQNSAVRFVTAKSWPERATKTRQYDLLRPNVGQKEPPKLGSTICYGQVLARKNHQDSAVRFVTAKSCPERATKTRQYDLLRPRVGQKEPPRLGSTICYGQTWARKSHQNSVVRFVTAKSWPERATKTRQYDLLRPNVGQKEPPKLGSTICYGQELVRKNHQDSAVRFVTAKSWPERATKTRQYDLLRPRVGQKEPPRLGSTICYDQTWARKSHQNSAVRFVTAKSWPERATKTRQYDLLRPNVGQKEPPELGSTICYGQELARKSHQDSAVRFVAAKRGPERATKTRQYDLLRPNVGQKEPPKLGSTICYGQELARKSHQDSAVRFVTAKRGPERATKTRQYDLLRPRVGQKEPPRLGSTFVAAKRGPERATKTRQYDLLRPNVGQKEPPKLGSTICYGRQYDLLRPNVGQKEPPKLGSTICYGQELARKKHQDSAVRFVTAKSCPERATKTRQYDLLRPNVGQKEPPRLGSTICYGQTWARKSHQNSAVRFVTAKSWPERATKTRQYDLLRPNVGQKEPPKLGSTICYGQELARKNHQDSAVRFVTAKSCPERATKTRQYDLLRPRVGQKEPPRLGSTICYGQTWARKSHQNSAVRFVTAKSWPERATKTRQYDLLRPNVGQKEPPELGSTICYGQTWARKSHQNSAVRFVTASQQEPPRLGSTICYGQTWARKSHQDSAVRFVTAKSWPERATKTRQYDLLRPRVGQKEPPRLGSTICYGQTWARKSHQNSAVRFVTAKTLSRKSHRDSAVRFVTAKTWARKRYQNSAVRFVTAKSWPARATKTRQYDLLRPRRGPERATKTRQYDLLRPRRGPERAHQDSAVRFVTAKRWPERATKTRQYDLLRPRVGQKEPPRLGSTICYGQDVVQKEPPKLGSTICYGQELARKRYQDSAVRFVTAKSCPERATKTRQYDLLRPRVGQKEPPRLGSTICYGQTWARKSHQNSAVRFVAAKTLARKKPPRLGSTICYGQDVSQKEPPKLGNTICYGQDVGQKEPPRLGSTICYGQTLARKNHQNSAVRSVTAKSWPERTTKTRQSDLLRPRVVQKEPPRLGNTICYGQDVGQKEPPRLGSTICYGQDVGQKEPPKLGSTICYGQDVGQKEPPKLGSTI